MVEIRYPTAILKRSGVPDDEAVAGTIKAWGMVLDDVSAEDVFSVWHVWMKSQKWAPDPSELRLRALDRDGRRPARMQQLQRALDAGTCTLEMRWELAELEAGAPLREMVALG